MCWDHTYYVKKPVFMYLFYRSIADLQCCVNFCYIAQWFSYIYIHTHTHTHYIYVYILFHSLFHYGLLHDTEYIALCCRVGPFFWRWCIWEVIRLRWRSRTVLFIHCIYNTLYLLIPNSHFIPSPLPSPWRPQICSLRLWLCVSQISLLCRVLDSTHKQYHMTRVFLWLTGFTQMTISSSMQAAANGSISFYLWLSTTPLSICATSSWSIFIYWWTFGLFPCPGYCK